MARFKFLVFALLVLGLWGAHLYVLSPVVASRAVDQAAERASLASTSVSLRIEQRRAEVQRALLTFAGANVGVAQLRVNKAPTPEVFVALRDAALAAVPEALRPSAVVVLRTEGASYHALGDGAPQTEGELNVTDAARAGGAGLVLPVGGKATVFYSVTLHAPAAPEPKVLGALALGLPVLPEGLAEGVAKDLRLTAVSVTEAGETVSAFGDKKLVEAAAQKTKPGQTAVVEEGSLSMLGPLRFPLLVTPTDYQGGKAPLELASRQAMGGTPYEVLAVAPLRAGLKPWADYQQLAAMVGGGLFLLTLFWTLIMGSGKRRAEAEEEDEGEGAPAEGQQRPAGQSASGNGQAERPGLPVFSAQSNAAIPDAPAPEEASPDDFQFGLPPRPTMETELPGELPPPPDPFSEPPPVANGLLDPAQYSSDNQVTTAYPVHQEGPDPFAALGAPPRAPAPDLGADFNPDATRVATVPEELLKVAASRNVEPLQEPYRIAPPPVASAMPRVQPMAQDPDEPHFQEVYRDFIATRERCGEGGDGLTFDKFAAKLRKNRDQLIQKYACRTVRFQVYVKDGKAALKATPVKD